MAGRFAVRMGTGCAVHRHREQVPLQVHHIHPLGRGGADVPDNRVTLCANAHGSVHALLDDLLRTGGLTPWSRRVRFGRGVRRYAAEGFARVAGR